MKCSTIVFVICCITGNVWGQNEQDSIPVAEFGGERITLEEFRIAYLEVIKKPHTFDSKKLREEFLDELIDRTLLAREAEKRGFTADEKYQLKVDAFCNKSLRAEHFDAVIRPQLTLTESEIEEAYLFTQEQRKIRHLFYQDFHSAESTYNALNQGARFDSLAKFCFQDTMLAHNSGDLGWVQWYQLDYDMAMTAFRQPRGVFSPPIKSAFGYHIIEVTDYKKNPLITRQQYTLYRRKAKHLLEAKLGDKYALDFVRALVSKAQITYRPDVMEFVENKFRNLFKRQPQKADQMSDIQINDDEYRRVELSLWEARNEIMATMNGRDYAVKDFIGSLLYIPYEATYRGFKDAFQFSVRDYLLEQDARERDLDKSKTVKMKTTIYRNYLLQLALRIDMIKAVSVSEHDIFQYYDSYRKKNQGVTLDQIRPIAQQVLLIEKKQKVVPEYLKKVKQRITIKKDLKSVHKYYDHIVQ